MQKTSKPTAKKAAAVVRKTTEAASRKLAVVVKKAKPLAKAYEPQGMEDKTYKIWEKSGFFNPDKLPGRRNESFTIMMPPPNATGTLHVGHAMFLTLEDIMTRYNRMNGKASLWIPGTDHAAIATNTKVEKILAKEGKTKYDLGRKGFIKRVETFIKGSQGTIKRQVRKMGASCDWSREAYTFDKPRSEAVQEMFVRMFNDGLIYRGVRIVNWCPRCESTLADDEVEYREQDAKLYYMKYGPFTVATTRPETKLGDTAVAVHPDDARYQKWIGESFTVDFGSGELDIRVIADREVDMNFGTGVVGLTPAHSAVDFAMAEKNHLPIKKVIDEKGMMTELAGKYAGMPVLEAREKLVADLTAKGLIEKIEDMKNNLSICYRCAAAIEPLTSQQWFVNVNAPVLSRGNKSLKKLALDAVRKEGIEIIPERFEKVYFHWMENLRDWCISRQLWFGHRIPVWYCEDCQTTSTGVQIAGTASDGREYRGVHVGSKAPKVCKDCGGKKIKEDPDTLDTWFSSGAWTFTTLGWPKQTRDLKKFHPTTVLETGYDILFFWVARMILMSTYAMGEIPFSKVYLHGLVRDEEGRKMSKSLENIIDPLDVAAKFGTDAVRLSLTIGNTPGNDLRISEEKIAHFRNFTNKLWNIARFIEMQGDIKRVAKRPEPKTLADAWILARLDEVTRSVSDDLEKLNLSRPGETLRDFTWNELADWYLEIAKIEGDKTKMLAYLLENILKLWHPFMPFVTEEIWGRMFARDAKDLLIVAKWPEVAKKGSSKKVLADFAAVQEIIVAIRNIRATYRVEPAKKVEASIIAGAKTKLLRETGEIIMGLAKVEVLTVSAKAARPDNAASAVASGVQVFVPLSGLVDVAAERERITGEIAEAQKYLEVLGKKLGNADFVQRAPAQVVEGERAKEKAAKEKIASLEEQLKALK